MKSALKSQLTSSKIIGSIKKDQKDSREATVKFITNKSNRDLNNLQDLDSN